MPLKSPTVTAASQALRRCLVIDDEVGMREMLAFGLTDLGFSAQTVGNGYDAVALAEKQHFDLVICDVMMPGKTGLDVLRELKKIRPTLKIVMVTGSPTDAVAVDCVREGAWGFISKPFTMDELCTVISDRFSMPAPDPEQLIRTPAVFQPAPRSGPIRKILIVDDEPSVVELFSEVFKRDGYHIETAADGRQALIKMTQDLPDAVVLDLMMPEVDGFYLLNAMQQAPVLQAVPVIVVTAKELTPQQKSFLTSKTIAVIQKGAQTVDRIRAALKQQDPQAA